MTRLAIAACPVCGEQAYERLGRRSDGVLVRRCLHCGMGVVAERPADLLACYPDAYYVGGATDGAGYADYAAVAGHSLPWAAHLVRLLQPAGKVLDVGAADGSLLRLLGDASYERHAIEVNETLLATLAGQGIRPLARDVFDDAALAPHRGSFDAVTAIAVLEHVADIRGALERLRDLLSPEGVLLFEVPLVGTGADEVWYRSSLEHVFYPTREGLEFLFAAVFGLPLLGHQVLVHGYGCTYVGVATPSADRHRELEPRVAALLAGPAEALTSPRERAFRFYFDVVHSADTSDAAFALLPAIDPRGVDTHLLARLAAFWKGNHDRARRLRAELDHHRGVEIEQLRATLTADLARERARATAASEEAADLRRQLVAIHTSRLWRHATRYWRLQRLVRAPAAGLRRALGRAVRGLGSGLARALRITPRGAGWRPARALFRRLPLRRDSKDRWMRRLLGAGYVGPAEPTAVPVSPPPREATRALVPQTPLPPGQPLVTVVIPSYQYAELVTETVDSVVAQTLSDVEILVVHSGPHEPTLRVLRELHRPRTTVLFREDPHLVGDNRNFGIARARGRYVCCVDSDDQIRPTYLEKAVYLLEELGFDLVSTMIEAFGDKTFVATDMQARPSLSDMLDRNHLPHCAVYPKEWWERAGGYVDSGTGDDHTHEDWRLFQRMIALGARACNIAEPLLRYRLHGVTLSSPLRSAEALARQAEAMKRFNADVIDDAAMLRSEELAKRNVRRTPPLLNLQGRMSGAASQPTVLIATSALLLGGAERLLSQIVRRLSENGVRVVLVTTVPSGASSGDSTPWFEGSTREIYHLPRFLDPVEWKDFVRYLLVTRAPQALWIVGSAFFYELLPEIKAEHPALGVLDLLFNTVGHTASNRRFGELIDLTIVENREVERWLLAAGEQPAKVRRIESGVDLERYRPASRDSARRAELAIPADALVVGFSGRFSEEKAPDVFLEVAERLAYREDIYFVMSGAGPLASVVEARVRAPGANPRLRFLGQVEDVRSALALYDVLLLPSRLDGRPVVVLEALAMGVPVVASRVGALPELVTDGRNGFLCAPGATGELALRIVELAADPALRLAMRVEARRFAEARLDVRAMLDRYESTLRPWTHASRMAAASR